MARFLRWVRAFRTQTLLFTVGLLLALGAVVAILGGWITHRLKQHLVEEAEAYAREEVARSAREIQEIMSARGMDSIASAAELPEVGQRIRMILSRGDGTIQMVAIVTPDQTIVRRFDLDPGGAEHELGPEETAEGRLPDIAGDYTFKIERIGLDTAPPEMQPAPRGEGELDGPPLAGYLAFQMADDLIGSERVRRLSGSVTGSLTWMVVLLLALLGAAVALLYKIFNRHLALEREKDAQAKMAAIGALASGLAHEIRNPLQVINMNLEVIREELEEAEEAESTRTAPRAEPAPNPAIDHARTARVLTGVQGQIVHLNRILQDFMQFAIPGRMEMEPFSLRALLADILEFMQPEFEKHGVEVKIDMPDEADSQGDPSALRRVFLNVLLNAVRAMESAETKRLHVRAEPDRESGWRVRIQDTGCGIPEGKEEEIFDAFVSFRAGGTGFGLAVARRILEEHGGHIRAEERSHGAGAAFVITLPPLRSGERPSDEALDSRSRVG